MPFLLSTQEQLANFRAEMVLGVAMVHVDTCLGSYLQDHHNRDGECLFGVHVNGATTVGEVMEGLKDEVRQTGDRLPEAVTDQAIADAIAATFEGADMAKPFSPSLEAPPLACDYADEDAYDEAVEAWDRDNEDGESCQAWFVLTWEKEGGDAD